MRIRRGSFARPGPACCAPGSPSRCSRWGLEAWPLAGSVEEATLAAQPMVLAAGVYAGTGSGQHLLSGPVWTGLAGEPAPAGDSRVLDLRTGVLERTELTGNGYPLRSLRLASITL